MKKLFLLLTIMLSFIYSTNAQVSDSYKNLEKYWYYRYRLVNDFTKIGEEPGESIPAQKRRIADDSTSHGCLSWGVDATADLGDYIAMLVTEFKQLENNGYSTNRTLYELNYALKALRRLDEVAEPYSDMVNQKIYPGMYPGTLTTSQINNWPDRYNGFFIRDDVPFRTFVNQGNNYQHFNRPGILDNPFHIADQVCTYRDDDGKIHKFDHYETAYEGRYLGPDPANSSGFLALLDDIYYTSPPVPPVPVEESQDQMYAIWQGLALATKFVHPFYNVGSNNLYTMAKEELDKTLQHIHDGNWFIQNPVTGRCAYGIAAEKYHSLGNLLCTSSGANFWGGAKAASKALNSLSSTSLSYSGLQSVLHEFQMDPNFAKIQRDVSFTDMYAAVGNAYIFRGRNITRQVINSHSIDKAFATPHLPLLYRLFWGGKRFDPEGKKSFIRKKIQKEPKVVVTYEYIAPSYEYLLNAAPPCGPYNYLDGNYGHIEWSGNNRLVDPYHRTHPVYGEGYIFHGKVDFNGLDYMYLFNLYSLTEKTYLQKMNNPYYCENFAQTMPESGGLGSHTNKLKLNFLEYVGISNKVNSNGNITIRGGKKIDIWPGHEVKAGASALYYIKDYNCAGGEWNEGEYHYAYTNQVVQHGVLQSEEFVPIEYGDEYIPEIDTFNNLDTLDDYWTVEDSLYVDSLKNVLANSEDPDEQFWYHYLYDTTDIDSSSNKSGFNGYFSPNKGYSNGRTKAKTYYKGKGSDALSSAGYIRIYPNPTTGSFTIEMPADGDYDIRVTNILGSTVCETQMRSGRKKEIQLNDALPPGTYTVHITGNDINHIEKIILTR